MSDRNPFEELERLLERMNRQLSSAGGGTGAGAFGTRPPSVDVADHGDEFVVTADLPGFEKGDIDVRIDDNRLRISADREADTDQPEPEGEDRTYIRRERSRRAVSRTVTLPEAVREEEVSADYRNGVLTVRLPRRGSEPDGTEIDVE